MEKPSPQEHDHAHALDDEDRGQKCRQLKGIRLRKWGSWVSEIRIPRSREKLWLGSYPTAQQAARAYDVAVYCLRGSAAKFNFPNSVPDIPSASSLSRREIQLAAAKYALDKLPSSPPSLQENDENNNIKASEEAASSSRSASVSETELWSDSHQILEEPELDLRECGSDGNYGCLALNLERMPSIDDALAWELIPSTWHEEEHLDMFVDPTELWNF